MLRYVDPDDGIVREDFLDFIKCNPGITGRSLADKVLRALRVYGVNLSKLRGQAYDGVGNMSGSTKRMAALLTAKISNCAAHHLNLVVVKSLQVTCVQNMIGINGKKRLFIQNGERRLRWLLRKLS